MRREKERTWIDDLWKPFHRLEVGEAAILATVLKVEAISQSKFARIKLQLHSRSFCDLLSMNSLEPRHGHEKIRSFQKSLLISSAGAGDLASKMGFGAELNPRFQILS